MKKINKINFGFLFFFAAMASIVFMPACKKTVTSSPVITGVLNYAASPHDSALTGIVPNAQWVVISGQNLQSAVQITFNGVTASFNPALLAANSAVVQIPSIVFSTIDTNKINTIQYTTTGGTTTFSFKLMPAVPALTAISDVFANPGDSVFISGTNLFFVTSVSYGGTNITPFVSNATGTSVGFVMPNPAPTSGNVVVTTKSGTAVLKIAALPTITGVSNEDAVEGDSVYVYGTYLKNIQTFTFAGATITSFVSSTKGASVAFKMPFISSPGPVSITTLFGTATTVYNVNNVDVEWARSATTGVLANMEWGNAFGWQWWGGSSLSVSDPSQTYGWITLCAEMTGSIGMFVSIKSDPVAAGVGGMGSNSIPIGGTQWMPVANITDTVSHWALKFEINIPNNWNGGSIAIQSGFTSSYTALYEPWQISSTSTANYSTKGWRTVTIPLTEFRTKDATLGEGKGVSVSSLANLFGTGNTGCNVFLKNYGSSVTSTGFYGGFDNFRVVKIK